MYLLRRKTTYLKPLRIQVMMIINNKVKQIRRVKKQILKLKKQLKIQMKSKRIKIKKRKRKINKTKLKKINKLKK